MSGHLGGIAVAIEDAHPGDVFGVEVSRLIDTQAIHVRGSLPGTRAMVRLTAPYPSLYSDGTSAFFDRLCDFRKAVVAEADARHWSAVDI